MYLTNSASKEMAKTIKFKLYEEFYKHTPITPDLVIKIINSSSCSQYTKNPENFKALANKISTQYNKFKINKNNLKIKEFITEKKLKNLIEETMMYNV